MESKWNSYKCKDVIEFNPKLALPKGTFAFKVPMENITPFEKFIKFDNKEKYAGGTKFSNYDTIMARITPCLENGKTAFIDGLDKNEVAFGSTEYIVLRAKSKVSDPQFIYYLSISPDFRKAAIASMSGSSGRQRVQLKLLEELEFKFTCPNVAFHYSFYCLWGGLIGKSTYTASLYTRS